MRNEPLGGHAGRYRVRQRLDYQSLMSNNVPLSRYSKIRLDDSVLITVVPYQRQE